MVNQRGEGMVQRTYWIHRDTIRAAQAKAAATGTNLSAVIREHLERYMKEGHE